MCYRRRHLKQSLNIRKFETFTRIPISENHLTNALITPEGWASDEQRAPIMFTGIEIIVCTAESSSSKEIGEGGIQTQTSGVRKPNQQPAWKTRTNLEEEEDVPEDIWKITIDPVIVDIPNRTGKAEAVTVDAKGNVTLKGVEMLGEAAGPMEVPVAGAWEGEFAGGFEGVATGAMELALNATILTDADASWEVKEPQRGITLDAAEAETRKMEGTASWQPKERFSFAQPWDVEDQSQSHETYASTCRRNTPGMIWVFLCKAPRYLGEDVTTIIPHLGGGDIPSLIGGSWVIEAKRAKIGDSMRISTGGILLTTQERMWIQITVGRRTDDEVQQLNDFCNVVIGIDQASTYW
jgi:hypothetical protein